jgi:hypothetical protein
MKKSNGKNENCETEKSYNKMMKEKKLQKFISNKSVNYF